MKYIPKKPSFPLDNSTLSLHDNSRVKISDIDANKVIEKYGDFQSGTSIGFIDEDGLEYNIIVGTRTSPINQVIIQGFLSDENPIFFHPNVFEENASKEAEKLFEGMKSFVYWIKSQNLIRRREGD